MDVIQTTEGQTDSVEENHSGHQLRQNKLRLIGIFLSISVLSTIVFGFFGFKNFGSAVFFICGDASCSPLQNFYILIILASTLVTFALPGIFLFSIINKYWKLPFLSVVFAAIPELLSFVIFTLQGKPLEGFRQIAGVVKFSGLFNAFLNGPISIALMLLIYGVSLLIISLIVHGLANVSSSKIPKLILVAEMVLFTIIIAISAIAPNTYTKVEKAVNPALKTANPGFGKIYYTANSNLVSLDSSGTKKTFQLPKDCDHIRIAWDQSYIFCSTDTTIWTIKTSTSEMKKISDPRLRGAYPSNQYSWSSDNKYLVFSTGGAMGASQLSDLYRLDIDNLNIEKLNNTSFSGTIDKAVYSPNSNKIAIEIDKYSDINTKLNSLVEVYDLTTKESKAISSNTDCTNDDQYDCYLTYLQFSEDSNSIFYTTETYVRGGTNPQGKYLDKLVLVNLSDLSKKEVSKYTKSGEFMGKDRLFVFNGVDSLIYFGPLFDKNVKVALRKLNLITGIEEKLPQASSDFGNLGSYLAFSGDWVVYRVHELGTYSVYVEKVGGDRIRILNSGEFPLVADDSQPNFVYWFK